MTANDVKQGKPQPDPYLAGAERVGVDPKNCKSPPRLAECGPGHTVEYGLIAAGLVVEDAPSGLIAGRAAGAHTLAVCTSHTRDEIVASGAAPDFIVDDLTRYETKKCALPVGHANRTLILGCLRGGLMAKLKSRSTTLCDKRAPVEPCLCPVVVTHTNGGKNRGRGDTLVFRFELT